MVDLGDVQRRTRRYEFADGMRDFQMAFWLLIVGVYAWLIWDMSHLWLSSVEAVRELGTVPALLVFLVLPIAVPLLISYYGLGWINETVRRRWLWRNTGYIKPRHWVVPRRVLFLAYILMFAVFILGILIAIQFKDLSLMVYSIYLGTGLEIAYIYWILGAQFAMSRYRIVSLLSITTVVLILFLPLTVGLTGLLVCGCLALLLILSGGYGLRDMAQQQRVLDNAS